MNIRVEWYDPGCFRFVWTDAPADPAYGVFETFSAAKEHALISARENRDCWGGAVRDLRSLRVTDVVDVG